MNTHHLKGKKKYKQSLKNCEGCKYKNHIIENGEKIDYCKIFSIFINKCDKKIIK